MYGNAMIKIKKFLKFENILREQKMYLFTKSSRKVLREKKIKKRFAQILIFWWKIDLLQKIGNSM